MTPGDQDLELLAALSRARRDLSAQIARRIIGQQEIVDDLVAALLAGGHALLVGVPGLAKTLLVKTVAEALDLSFSRIQFTPDLMPSDITGTELLEEDPSSGKRVFRYVKGPVFANAVLADEINRAPPKTQAALLQAMQEHAVTAAGQTHALPEPFFVLATQNPIEQEGTYPLPEAQLDRFILRLGIGYPSRGDEWQVLARRIEREVDEIELAPVVDSATLLAMQRALEEVHVSEQIGLYMVDLVSATRTSPRVQVGSSPRGTLALLKLSRGRAVLNGRDFVTPDDVKAVAVPALAHRVTLRPELWVQRISGEDLVREALASVPTPAADA